MVDLVQFVASRSAEVGVQSQYLDGELHLVDHALAGAVLAPKQFEIAQLIVEPVAVNVVHRFFGEKFTAKALFHYVSVLKDFIRGLAASRRESKHDVVSFDSPSYSGKSVFFSVDLAHPLALALLRAKSLFSVYPAALFSLARGFFTAVHANVLVLGLGIFPPAGVRTFFRAVQRIAAELLLVCGQVRLHHDERLLAVFAGEVDRRPTGGWKRFAEAMTTSAGQTAILAPRFGVARVAVKRLVTVLACHLDRHGYSPLFGNEGGFNRVARGCQVAH